MKKPSSKIREDIARLQDQLRQAETREAERIGRVALKAGLGEVEIVDDDLLAAFREVAARFRQGRPHRREPSPVGTGQIAGGSGEA